MNFVKRYSKLLVFIIVGVVFNSIASAPNNIYISAPNSKVIAEGVLTRIVGGGTQEIRFPSGYAITNPIRIISPSVPFTNSTIFLRSYGFSLKEFIDQWVHVEGEFLFVPSKKINQISFTSAYYKIVVDTIYCTK